MNPILNELLSKAAIPLAPVMEKKQEAAVAASAEKQAALGGLNKQSLYNAAVGASTNKGVASSTEAEYDSRYLTPMQMFQKYGFEAANRASLASSSANQAALQDELQVRDFSQTAGDAVSGIGMGIASGIGGIGALGLGVANENAGAWASKQLQDLTEFGQSTQSPALQARRRLLAAKNMLDERDSTQKFEADVASGKSSFMSGLSRIGRDVISSVGNAGLDITTLSDGVAQGVGSLMAISPVSALLSRAGGAASKYGVPLAIGSLEAGGSYQQSTNDVMAMSHEELLRNSPDYAAFVLRGATPEEARTSIASQTGLTAAALTLPAAIAAGKLVDSFAGQPLKAVSGRAAAGNLIRETTEEGIQGGVGQLAQNQATQLFADASKSLSDGVGSQIGTGALYGLGTAAALQAPAATISGGAAAVATGLESLIARGQRMSAAAEAKSPASINRVAEQSESIFAAVPEMDAAVSSALEPTQEDTPEVLATKQTANTAYSGFLKTMQVTPEEAESPLFGAASSAIASTDSRIGAAIALVQEMNQETNPKVNFGKAVALTALLSPFVKAANSLGDVDTLTMPEEVQQVFEVMSTLESALTSSPEMQRAMQRAGEFLSTPDGQGMLNDLNQTVESAQVVAAAAQIDPTKVNPDVAGVVLRMAQNGSVNLSQEQLNALQSARALMQAVRAYDAELKASGEPRPKDIVTFQVKTEDDAGRNVDGRRSALQHAQQITKLVNSGDMVAATGALNLLGMFAQSQANKVQAFNDHFADGPNAPRKTAKVLSSAAGFKFVDSTREYGVTPTKPGSLRLVNLVAAEARFLANLHNGLAAAYFGSEVSPLPVPELDAILQGKSGEVAAEFAKGIRTYGSGSPVAAVATPIPVAQPTPVVAPVKQAIVKQEPKKQEPVVEYTEDYLAKVSKTIEKMSDEALDQRLDVAMAKPGYQNDAVFKLLDSAMAKRENDFVEAAYAEPEPVVEEVKAEPETTVAEPVAEVKELPKTITEAYPALYTTDGEQDSSLAKAFTLRKTPSRLFGSGSPVQVLKDALSTPKALADFIGSNITKREITGEIASYYSQRVPEMTEKLVAMLNRNLASALTTKSGKSDSLLELMGKGTAVQDMLRGKVVAIAEPNNKGGYSYNPELIESAVLAGLHWFQNASNNGPIREKSDIADILDVDESSISAETIARFNQGNQLLLGDVVPRIAQSITEFWGVKSNPDYTQSAVIGIPQAVASEVLRAFVEAGLIEQSQLVVAGSTKVPNVFTLNADVLQSTAYKTYPTLLAELAKVENTETMYFEGAVPPLATTQMNNADIALTPAQISSNKFEQATPYKLNAPVFDLYNKLGIEGLLTIFGAGDVDADAENLYNVNHLDTVKGKNTSVVAAWESLDGRVAEMGNIAAASGKEITDVVARFAYGTSKVGRQQMLGKQNPQASKLVREALMPTESTIDLEDTEQANMYILSLAQMLGVKVHTKSLKDSIQEVEAMLQGPLKPAVELLAKGGLPEKLDDVSIAVLKDAVKAADSTVMALHAMVDYARMLTTDDLSQYKTMVYVEADGVTNGPVNALVNLTSGEFTNHWRTMVAKGGLFLEPNKSFNSHRTDVDGADLYREATTNFSTARNELAEKMQADGAGMQMKHLMRLMGIFIKDVVYREVQEEVNLSRGIAKNPLTITVYGSGARGIANKVTDELMASIYAKMSKALQNKAADPDMSWAEAMFGVESSPNHTAEAMLSEFESAMSALTSTVAVLSKKTGTGVYQVWDHSSERLVGDKLTKVRTKPVVIGDLAKFTLQGANLQALQENMLTMFVKPLREGIRATLGEALMSNMQLLQTATQVQSIALQYAFKSAVENAVSKVARKDTQFLSSNEQQAVMREVLKKFPTVKTGEQEFLIASSSQSTIKASDFSRALNDTFAMKAAIYAPAAAGVAGSPILNIGMGDAAMMQAMGNMVDAIQGTLKIFDGVNMPVDKIKLGSLQANTAVAESWKGNPMRAVADSFNAAKKSIEETISKLSQTEQADYLKAMKSLGLDEMNIADSLNYLNDLVEDAAMSIEARKVAMSKVTYSVDQMASAASPFTHEGEDISSLVPEEQINKLNSYYYTALDEIKTRRGANKAVSAELKGRITEDKPVVLYTFEGLLQEVPKLPADLQETAKQALRSSDMRKYVVTIASANQINEMTSGLLGNANGITDIAGKRIYLTSADSEVLVHELVHAATMEKVAGVVTGTNKDTATVAAVERMKALRDQFLEMSYDSTWSTDQVITVRNAQNSMEAARQEFGEAAELNELMAWATTNESLIELGRKTKAAPSALKDFTRKVVNTLRRIFFGSAPDKLPKDFFNAVRFNTALIAQAKPFNGAAAIKKLIARHNTSYGNDARLNQVQETYMDLMEPLFKDAVGIGKRIVAENYAAKLASTFAKSFAMSQQEKSVFETIVAALFTEAQINPAAMAKAQELYTYVTKQVSVASFEDASITDDTARLTYAQEKYNLLLGKSGVQSDSIGRTSLMPSFLALATTNNEFRILLSKMELPKSAKHTGGTLDDYLRNLGTNAMDGLGNKLAGTKSNSSVDNVVDALHDNVKAIAESKESLLSQGGTYLNGKVNALNDRAVDFLGSVSKAGVAYGDKMRGSNNKYVSKAAGIVKVSAYALTDETAGIAAEGTLAAMNTLSGLQPLRDFANDIIGRTVSNATVYDMIKRVRSTVAAVRQEFRENVPAKLVSTFKNPLTEEQWDALTKVMAKTDMAALKGSFAQIAGMVENKFENAKAILAREAEIKAIAGVDSAPYLAKALQLATFMNTGKPGTNLLRNAEAIAGLFGEPNTKVVVTPKLIKSIDQLVSLYAMRDMQQAERTIFNDLYKEDAAALKFVFSYLKQQAIDETTKAQANSATKFNYYKGYVPSIQNSGVSLVVADDATAGDLLSMSYERVGDYVGAKGERGALRKGYYFSNTPAKAAFSQGIVQNVVSTAGGVSTSHGYTQGMTAGVVNDPVYVTALTKRISLGSETGTVENLLPIFDSTGTVIAYERSIDPMQRERLQSNNQLHQMLGVWRGRQVEEAMADAVNNQLVDNLKAMYDKDAKAGKQVQYVNIFDPKDKILEDAIKLMPAAVRDYMANVTGTDGEFMVRKDMMFDAFGYRAASVGDIWTGNSRYSDDTRKTVRNLAIGIAGNKAFGLLVNGESIVTSFMAGAKSTIVVRSVVVPMLNLVSNMLQLLTRGVPLKSITGTAAKKTAEIDSYVKSRIREVDVEAEMRAAPTTNAKLKLQAEIDSIRDGHKRLSIWPLIEAGEFTAISDVGISHDDLDLSQGRWHDFFEKQVDRLPESLRNAGRYALVTQDTALFQGLQKAVQYGDFLAKSILYDDLTIRKKLSPGEAMAAITEEFVNYDRLPGRFRGYLEQIGLLWFYNFKLRSTKVAASMLRNNPVQALLSSFTPGVNDIGSPITDNVLTKAFKDSLGYSVGPGMGINSVGMNPWLTMVN